MIDHFAYSDLVKEEHAMRRNPGEHVEQTMFEAHSAPSPAKKNEVLMLPATAVRTVRVVWEDKDATDSSSDDESDEEAAGRHPRRVRKSMLLIHVKQGPVAGGSYKGQDTVVVQVHGEGAANNFSQPLTSGDASNSDSTSVLRPQQTAVSIDDDIPELAELDFFSVDSPLPVFDDHIELQPVNEFLQDFAEQGP